jgi:uncharacterized protein (TIGR04222 family)
MSAIAADTWGIPGQTFIFLFIVAMIAAHVVTAVLRSLLRSGSAASGEQHPYEVAYLSGGPQLAIATALAALRADGAVISAGRGTVRALEAQRTMRTPLDDAVYDAIRQGRATSVRALRSDQPVRYALDQLHDGLVHKGLALSSAGLTRLRLAAIPLVAVVVVGLVRLAAGLMNDKPVVFLIGALAIAGVMAVNLIRKVPRTTKAGDSAVRHARRRYSHLSPASSPAWQTYGPAGAALGVGLFGLPALSSLDPAFAEEAQLGQNLGLSGGGSSGWSSSSSSGGSSCSGGSSGGGGGSSCGGGGGGGGGGCGG